MRSRRGWIGAVGAAALLLPATLWAQQSASPGPAEIAAAFGARELVQDISLSPDGRSIAVVEPTPGRGSAVMVLRTDTPNPQLHQVLTASGSPERLTGCDWIANDRMICRIYMIVSTGELQLGYTRLLAIDADGGNPHELIPHGTGSTAYATYGGAVIDFDGGAPGTVLVTSEHVEGESTGSLSSGTRSGMGVDRLDVRTLHRSTIEAPVANAVEYISDGRGTVRIMGVRRSDTNSGYDTGGITWMYRRPGSREWHPMGETASDDAGRTAGFEPVAVDPDANAAYGFSSQGGRAALFRVSLDGSLRRELVFSRPDVDVDHIITVGRQRRVVGASFADDRRHSEFFDPALHQLQASLGRAIPGLPLITFVDASEDGNMLLLLARSDVDPGRYYLLDRTSRHMVEVLPSRPQLAQLHLATVRSVSFPAADGTMIPAYLTLPPGSEGHGLPAVVMPHGGPGARDEWGFDWLAQFLAQRGYAVLQPNFRGSTGYGDAWFQQNGFQSWRTAIGDVDAGGRWLVSQGIGRADALAIVGWSYGGYAALQSQVLDPDLFKAVVAIAPVTDLDVLRQESLGLSNHRLIERFIGQGPNVTAASPAQHAAQFRAPVLMFHGDRDRNVGIAESRLMASRLRGAGKSVELVEFPGLDHQLDDDRARTQMLARLDSFLRTSLHLPQ